MIKPFGLYVHIPFCAKLCHYCDFAKTSNFSTSHVASYIEAVKGDLAVWGAFIPSERKFTSVFFGGGTPGLLTTELRPLMQVIQPRVTEDAEITLECNPSNVSAETVAIWKDMGINRLSIGVQTFDPEGLQILTRDHTADLALASLKLAASNFPKSNGDLIYGWPGQTIESWRRDIQTITQSGVNHLSLYALTYEGQTPFARAERRGAIRATSGDEMADFYQVACEELRVAGYLHEEVSNWSKPGKSCRHNWLYWRCDEFIGVGAGAHGFLENGTDIGLRYQYPGDFRSFLRAKSSSVSTVAIEQLILQSGGIVDDRRDQQSWLFEYVGCGLRCREGISLALLRVKGFQFRPNAQIERALNENLMTITGDYLRLSEAEWFRETAWSLEVCDSCILS